MIFNSIKIALRNLLKQKSISFINIFGLSVGIACFSLILLYAVNEFNYDVFHKDIANLYQVYLWRDKIKDMDAGGGPYLPMPLGKAMKSDFPDVVDFVRFRDAGIKSYAKISEQDVRQLDLSYADPVFFDVFSFNIIFGDKSNALKDLHSLVLTRTKAKELFGTENAVNRRIEIKINDTFQPFTVTAISEDVPSNSSITYSVLLNFEYFESLSKNPNDWRRYGLRTYVKLIPGSALPFDKLRKVAFRKKYYPEEEADQKRNGVTWNGDEHYPVFFDMMPLRKVHTDIKINAGIVPATDPKNIWMLICIALGVLGIACINFTTLAIGRSAGRAKEIGVRKVIGSDRSTLALQFLTEAMILTFLSAGVGLLLTNLGLPFFNQLADKELRFTLYQFPQLKWMYSMHVVLVGLMAGFYPAIVLSGFKPIEVLRRKVKVHGANLFTKSLVTFQFVISIVLITTTIFVLKQVEYMRGIHPGFNKENVVIINGDQSDSKKIFPLFVKAIRENPAVTGVATAELGLGEGTGWNQSTFEYDGKHKEVYEYFVDHNYIPVLGIQLLAGRNFDPTMATDTQTAVIVNEAMVRDFGWTMENAIGRPLKGYTEDGSFTPIVIGVVKDFHFRPLTEKIEPEMFQQFRSYQAFKLFIRLRPGNPAPVLAALQNQWQKIEPTIPFDYNFLDNNLNRFYKAEDKWSSVIVWAGTISIFLACLGLFGLAALASVNRIKEIGIRKVLGSSSLRIVQLISMDFLKLIGIAIVIATPIAWYLVNKVLQNFAYRIPITVWIFMMVGILALFISVLTTGAQALKTAMINPVKSLRSE